MGTVGCIIYGAGIQLALSPSEVSVLIGDI